MSTSRSTQFVNQRNILKLDDLFVQVLAQFTTEKLERLQHLIEVELRERDTKH